MKTKAQKKAIVEDLSDKIKRQKSLVLTDMTGINVAQITDLRRKLRAEGIEYKAAKKTLIDLALKSEKQEMEVGEFNNSLALAFGYSDPIAPIKILSKFQKENGSFKILAALMEGKILSSDQIKELANLPSRDQLITIVIGGIKAPISGFVNVLQGNLRSLIGILNALANK